MALKKQQLDEEREIHDKNDQMVNTKRNSAVSFLATNLA